MTNNSWRDLCSGINHVWQCMNHSFIGDAEIYWTQKISWLFTLVFALKLQCFHKHIKCSLWRQVKRINSLVKIFSYLSIQDKHLVVMCTITNPWDRQALTTVPMAPKCYCWILNVSEDFAYWSEYSNVNMQDQNGENIDRKSVV